MNQISDKSRLKVVGTRPIRPDGFDKVTGKAAYGADLVMPGMLHAAVLRSPHAHARIVSIDTKKAAAFPGVKAVITGADMPKIAPGATAAGEQPVNVKAIADTCIAQDKVLFAGQVVAAVAATSKAIALQAVKLIEAQYEVLPHVIDVEAAMAPDAPLLHDDIFTKGLPETPTKPSNIASFTRMPKGDPKAAIEAADVVFEGRFTGQPVHMGYIEPHACVAHVSADGQAQVWASSQGQFMVRAMTAAVTGLSLADVRVTPAEIGGGFGGKTRVYIEPLAVMLSKLCGRPVKMVMSREEVFRGSGPAPGGVVEIRMGANKDGRITGVELEMKYQAGAFPGSPMVAGAMTALSTYDLENYEIKGWDVVCNIPKVAAYRAPGANPAQLAVECAIDELARKLGLDPVDMRLRNIARDGCVAPYGATYQSVAFAEVLEAAKAHPHYSAPLPEGQGRGVATGFWFNAGGDSTVNVTLTDDGTVVVATGNPDIGGSRASNAMMTAEALGLPLEKVRVIVTDTASIGPSMLTGGSSTTLRTGAAIAKACEDLITQMRGRAAMHWGVQPDEVVWRDGQAHCLAREEAPLSTAGIGKMTGRTGGPVVAEVALHAQSAVPTIGAHICDVEVDRETGVVRIVRYTTVQDVGKAVHPAYVEGQLQGGATQGIGWALNEEYVYDDKGRLDNAGFLDYRMPVASDLPMIETVLVEVPNARHPFGVKGVGETPIVPPPATIANAVRDATGVRFLDLPLSPTRVLAGLNGQG